MDAPNIPAQVNMDSARYAGFWVRFGAHFIDSLLWGFIAAVLTFGYMFLLVKGEAAAASEAIPSNIGAVVAIVYYSFFTSSSWQATPGKRVLGLAVVRPDGSRITLFRALGRFVAYFLSYITLLLGFVMAGFMYQKKALHDIAAGTRVIHAKL